MPLSPGGGGSGGWSCAPKAVFPWCWQVEAMTDLRQTPVSIRRPWSQNPQGFVGRNQQVGWHIPLASLCEAHCHGQLGLVPLGWSEESCRMYLRLVSPEEGRLGHPAIQSTNFHTLSDFWGFRENLEAEKMHKGPGSGTLPARSGAVPHSYSSSKRWSKDMWEEQPVWSARDPRPCSRTTDSSETTF